MSNRADLAKELAALADRLYNAETDIVAEYEGRAESPNPARILGALGQRARGEAVTLRGLIAIHLAPRRTTRGWRR